MDQAPTSPGSRNRTFSFRSDRSAGSKTSSNKLKSDYTEDPKEKARRDSIWRETSKANPNAALGEAQPVERATFEKTTLDSLRDLQHKDATGSPIAEPDLSNPTRPRWERPLDTIRSFESSIDSGYKRRSSMRQESYEARQQQQKRNSYFDGRYAQSGNGGYYNNRSAGPDNSYAGGPSNSRLRYGGRMQSDSNVRYPGYNPQHGYHGSYDTVNTGGSDSTGPWANSTDPSSESSSLDRVHATMKPQDNSYAAQNGYGGPPNQFQGPIYEEGPGQYGGYPPQQGGHRPAGGPPMQPQYGGNGAPRRPIPLGQSRSYGAAPNMGSAPPSPPPKQEPEKKKGWLKRRFSKNV